MNIKKILRFAKKHWLLLSGAILAVLFVFMTPHQRARFVIHFFCAGGVLTLSQAGFWLIERKVKWLPRILKGWWWFIIPGVAAVFAIGLREPFDVGVGGEVFKSYFVDYPSWILGVVVYSWGRWRLHEREALSYTEIKAGRR